MSVLRGRSASRSRGRSAKFELIMTTRVSTRGSIGQSRLICQVWCSGIQGIYSWFMEGPSAKVGSSANFSVLVFKESLLYYLGGGTSAKVCSSAKFCVPVCKASMLYKWGVHLPKYVHLPCFVYWYSRHLCSINGGYIGQRRFVCQIWTHF